MLIGSFIHPLAIVLQLLAIILALRLMSRTGRSNAWLVFLAAFALMGVRRIIELLEHTGVISGGISFNNLNNLIALSVSLLIAIGVYLIRGIFEERQRARQKLQQQLDELLRFQKVTVGRELRMKELTEENAALRGQLESARSGGMQS